MGVDISTETMLNVPMSGTETATRVADVLLLFLSESSMGVTAIAQRLDLSKAVVHRILQSLQSRGLVAYNPVHRTYRLGPAAAALGARALSETDLRELAMPVLHQLVAETGETATVSALVGLMRVYLAQSISPREVKMTVEIGRPFPLHAGASSRAILAFVPTELQERVLAGRLDALTPRTPTSAESIRAKLLRVRRELVAESRGERESGAASVASPVFGRDGVVGSISVCGPADRFGAARMEELKPIIVAAAKRISAALGGAAPV